MGERIAQEHRRVCGTRNRRDKTVAAPRHVGHIASTRPPFAEGLAQCRNVIAKVALIDHKARPHFCEYLLLGNYLGPALDEGDENVEGTATDPNRDAVFFEDPLRCGQTKRTKTEHVLRNRPSRLRIHDIHFLSPRYAPRSDLIFNDGFRSAEWSCRLELVPDSPLTAFTVREHNTICAEIVPAENSF